MKYKPLKRLTRHLAPPAHLVALLLAVGAVGSAWATAPTATVVWESDFGTATKTGTDGKSYTITLNGNSVNSNGNLVINNSNNSNLGATIDISSSPTKASILIRYSSLATKTTSRTLATFVSNGYTFGAQTIGNNTREMRIYENSTTSGRFWTPNSKPTLVDGTGYLLMTYDRADGTYAYTGSLVSALSGDGSTAVKYTQSTLSKVSVGGPCAVSTGTFAYAWDGVVIEKVAIFVGSAPKNTDIADYVWPSEITKAALATWLDGGRSVLAWREDASGKDNFHESALSAVRSDGTMSTPVAMNVSGGVGYTSFNYDNSAYTKPGWVMYYDKSGYKQSSNATFSELSFGGMCVTAEASEGNPYTIIGSGDRGVNLGHPDYTTYFRFDKSFTFNRTLNRTEQTEFKGIVNVTIAEDAVFDVNSAQENATYPHNCALASGATLSMSGEGQMKLGILNAANGTLDFSALSSRTAALPFINGTVRFGANTGIVLPAGTTSPYTIGTTVTGTFPSEITIGDKTYKATVTSGENAGEIAWTINSYDINSEVTLTLEDMFTSTSTTGGYEINVKESATLSIASATTIGSLTINVASGKTLTIIGSALTVSNGITVSGSSGFVKMASSLLLGTFAGDSTIIYSGVVPTSSSRNADFTSTDWEGVVWVENITSSTALRISDWVSTNSKVKLTNVLGYLPGHNGSWQLGYDGSTLGELILENTDSSGTTRSYGFCKNDGWSKANYDSYCKFSKLSGSGTLTETSGKTQYPCFIFEDGSEFTGVIEATQGMGIVFGSSSSSFASKRIAIDANEEVTIPAGSTWSASSGFYVSGTLNANGTLASAVTVNDGGVLNVASTASLAGAISGAGTVVGNQQFPVPGSSFTGTLTINAASAPLWTESNATAIYGSVLNIASGMAYLSGNVTHLPDAINIANNSYLVIGNADMASLTLNIDSIVGTGMLYINDQCTSLAALTINAGTNRGFANNNFAITSSTTLSTVNIVLDEVKGEGGTITLTNVSGLTAVEGRTYNFTVNRVDGTTVTGTYDSAASTVSYTPSISSATTDIDWDFTDGEDDALEQKPSDVGKNADSTMTFYTDDTDSTKTGVYIKHHPYITGAASFMGNNSAAMTVAVVGTMPATSNTIFLNVGSAYAQQYGLVFVTTAKANEVLIGYNYGGTVTPITTMTVPNSSAARHSYIVTKEDGDSTTTFTVYLDGIKWKTVTTASKIVFASSNSGVQVGSDFGGNIRAAGTYSAASDNVGVLNVLRVYGRIITEAEIAVYADTYPYVSPNGASSRTFATAAEVWVEATDTDWTNTNSSGTTTQGTTPSDGASVTVTADVATEITVNLASDTQYEALTINGSAVTLKKGTNSGKLSVTGMTVIGAPVTVEYGAADFTGGPMTITEDGSITFDYSAYDISEIYTTTYISLTSDVDQDNTKVTLTPPIATYQTATLVYRSGQYEMCVTPVHEAGTELYYKSGYWSSTENSFSVVDSNDAAAPIFPGDVVIIDSTHATVSEAWVADTFPANLTSVRIAKNFTFHSGVSAAIFGGVTVAVDEGVTLTLNNSGSQNSITLGAATLDGPGSVAIADTIGISGAVTGTAVLTISGTVNVASGGSIANTLAGSGTLAFAAVPSSALTLGDWTGTVSLPSFWASSGVNFNNYGTTGSTVALAEMTGGYILEAGKTISPTLQLNGDMTITTMSSWPYTFAEITGVGNLSFSTSQNDPTVEITKVAEGYSGTITSTLANTVTIATLAREAGTSIAAGAKLLNTGNATSVTVEAVTVGGEAVELDLEYKDDGVYVSELQGIGYWDGTTAVITNTSATVDISGLTSATAVVLYPTGNSVPFVATSTQMQNISTLLSIKVKYTVNEDEQTQDITSAFTSGSLSQSGDNYAMTLSFSGTDSGNATSVTVGNETIPVTPVAGSESATVVEGKPTIPVKTIPGLWYSLESCDTANGTFAAETTVQATSTTTSLTATAEPNPVKYYKLGVDVAAPAE